MRSNNIFNNKSLRREISEASLSIFEKISKKWNILIPERCVLLGDIDKKIYRNLNKSNSAILSRDQLERIALLLSIHEGLHTLFADYSSADRWLKSSNDDIPFGGKSPLKYILQGSIIELYGLKKYIDTWINA